MNEDLQGIVESFSAFFGVTSDIGLVLVSVIFAYVVLGIWALDRLVRRVPAPIDLPEVQQRAEEVIEASPAESALSVESEAPSIVEEPKGEIPEPDQIKTDTPKEVPQKLSERLTKTSSGFFDRIKTVFSSKPKLDPEMIEELEYLLITSDLGVKTVTKLITEVKADLEKGTEITESFLIDELKTKLRGILGESVVEPLEALTPDRSTPLILMMVGVNGVGKTTTCAKLASRLTEQGLKVMLVAADTFRAAAVMQLTTWGDRLGIPVISGVENGKPQAVVFDAMEAAKKGSFDVILIDTAGRLHTKASLMQELEGLRNTVQRHFPEGPQEVLLVVDGSTGQNALNQAKEFNDAVSLTGLVVTKLDGTPKGGIVVAIREELQIPVRYIGVGESHLDLRPFNAPEFVDALFDRTVAASDDKVSAHGETRRRKRRQELTTTPGDLSDLAS